MTIALCLHCGSTKFGAFVPCRECDYPRTGIDQVDVAFTDHFVHPSTLEELGAVIRAIAAVEQRGEQRTSAFLAYVSRNHPVILRVTMPEDVSAECDAVLARAALPTVTYRPGHRITHPPPPRYDIRLPGELTTNFLGDKATHVISRLAVDVKLNDGTIHRTSLYARNGAAGLSGPGTQAPFAVEAISAIRRGGYLWNLFGTGPWFELRSKS